MIIMTFFAHQFIIIIVAISAFPDFAPLSWFVHWKYDKIILFSPPPPILLELGELYFHPSC